MNGANAIILLTLAGVFLLLVFALLWAGLMLWGAVYRKRQFQRGGAITEGEVVERKVRHFRNRPQYYVVYRFTAETPDGRVFRVNAEENTWWTEYDRLVEGTKVFVEYVPRSPEVSRLSPVQKVVPPALA